MNAEYDFEEQCRNNKESWNGIGLENTRVWTVHFISGSTKNVPKICLANSSTKDFTTKLEDSNFKA